MAGRDDLRALVNARKARTQANDEEPLVIADFDLALAKAVRQVAFMYTRAPPKYLADRVAALGDICGHFNGSDTLFRPMVAAYSASGLQDTMTFGQFILGLAMVDEAARLAESDDVDSVLRAVDRNIKSFQLEDVLAFLSQDPATAHKDQEVCGEFAVAFVVWYKQHGGDPIIFLETQDAFVQGLLSDATTEGARREFMERLIATCWLLAPISNTEKMFLSTHWSSVLPWKDYLGEKQLEDVAQYRSTHPNETEYIAEQTVLQMDVLLGGFRLFPFHQRTITEDADMVTVKIKNVIRKTQVRQKRAWALVFPEATRQKQAFNFPLENRADWATSAILAQLTDLFALYYHRVITANRLMYQFAQMAIDKLDVDPGVFNSQYDWENYASEEVGRMVFIFEDLTGQNLLDLTWSFGGDEAAALKWEGEMLELYTKVKQQQMKNIKGIREVRDEADIIDPEQGDDDDDDDDAFDGESSFDDVDPNAPSSDDDDDDGMDDDEQGRKALTMNDAQRRINTESPWLNFFYILECHGAYLADHVRDNPTMETDVLTALVLDKFAPLFDGKPIAVSPVDIQTWKKSLILRKDHYKEIFESAHDEYAPISEGDEEPRLVALKRNLWAYSQVVFADREKRKQQQDTTWRSWKPSLARAFGGFHLFRIFRAQFELGYYGIDRMPGTLVSTRRDTAEWERALSALSPFVNDEQTLTRYRSMRPDATTIDDLVSPSQLLVEQAWGALSRETMIAWMDIAQKIGRANGLPEEWWLDDRGTAVPYPHWQDSHEVLKFLYNAIERTFQRTVHSPMSYLIQGLPVVALKKAITKHVRSPAERDVWQTIVTSCKTMTKVFERLDGFPDKSIHGVGTGSPAFCGAEMGDMLFERLYVSRLVDKSQRNLSSSVFTTLVHRADVPLTLADHKRHLARQPHNVFSGLGPAFDTLSIIVLRALIESGDYNNSIFIVDGELTIEQNVDSESSDAPSDEDLSDLGEVDDNDADEKANVNDDDGGDAMDIDEPPVKPRELPRLEDVVPKEPSEHFFHMLDCHGVDVPGAFSTNAMELDDDVDATMQQILSNHAHLWFSYQHVDGDTIPQQLAGILLENSLSDMGRDIFETTVAEYMKRNSTKMERRLCSLRARLWAFTKVAERLRSGLHWDAPYMHRSPGFHLFRIVNAVFGLGFYRTDRAPAQLLRRVINGLKDRSSEPIGDQAAQVDRATWKTFYTQPLFVLLGESTRGQLSTEYLTRLHGQYTDTQLSNKVEEIGAARLLLVDQVWLLLPEEIQKAWTALAHSFKQGPLRCDRAWWFDPSPTAAYPRWLHGVEFYDQVIDAIRARFLAKLTLGKTSLENLRGPVFLERASNGKKEVERLGPNGSVTIPWKTAVNLPSPAELDDMFKGTGPLIDLIRSIKAGHALETLTLLIDNIHLRNVWKGTILNTNAMADILMTAHRFTDTVNLQLSAALPGGLSCFRSKSSKATLFTFLTGTVGIEHLDATELSIALSLPELAAPSASDLMLHRASKPHHMDIGLGRYSVLAMVLARMIIQCVDSGTQPPVFPRKKDNDDPSDLNQRPLKKPRTGGNYQMRKLAYLMRKLSLSDF